MISRYSAQERLPEFGKGSHELLVAARVLIVGCGALGSPVAMYLAGAGVGRIAVADFDTVDLSNLHRQVFYSEGDVGKSKVQILRRRMEALNSEIEVEALEKLMTPKTLEEFLYFYTDCTAVVDAADNPATTYMLDSFCRCRSIPFVTAGVSGWNAQVFIAMPGSLGYSDIFPRPEEEGGILPCSIAGIAGPVSAFAASLQAAEVLKIIVGKGPQTSRLLTANLLSGKVETVG